MKDLKTVLLFFSFSVGSFLVYLSLNLVYFFAIIAVTIMAFIVGYKSQFPWLFPAYIAAAVPLIFWGLPVIFLKRRLALSVDFARFLARQEDGSNTMDGAGPAKVELPRDIKQIVKEIKVNAKKGGIKCLSAKLTLALAAVRIGAQETPPALTADSHDVETLRRWKGYSARLSLLELLAFLILFIPFGLISFIFTLGMDSIVTQLIFVMGFFFAWFLHSGIVTPIAGLILQGKMKGEG